MAKDNTPPVSAEAAAPLIITLEQLKQLLEEVKKPYIDPLAVAKQAEAKAWWAEQQRANKELKEAKERACRHIRPEDSKSTFLWMPFQDPPGAWYGVCSRCEKEIRNYEEYKDKSTGKSRIRIIDNPEYTKWKDVPTGVFNG